MTKTGVNSSASVRGKIRRTVRLGMVLWPLCFVMGFTSCHYDKPNVKHEIPESLLTCRNPRMFPPADTATQADVDAVLTDTYLSWEQCFENLCQVRDLIKKAP